MKIINDLIYDVGMHKGEDTEYYLKKGFKVIGIEADPDLSGYCRNKFSIEIEKGNLIIIEGAIVEPTYVKMKNVKAIFFKNKNNSVWGTVDRDWATRNERMGTSNEIIEVPIIYFSDILEKYGIPHYLKIDIEGMDVVCLKALQHFEIKPSYVSIESNKVSFKKLQEELELLKQLGYTGFKAIQQYGISHQKEPNPSKEHAFIGYCFLEGSSGLFGEDLPSKWLGYHRILKKYKRIFIQYKLFGDYGRLSNLFVGKVIRKFLTIIIRKPIPGWYDTHAKHSSVLP